MNSFLLQICVAGIVGLCSGYPSYSQDNRGFFYQVPIQSTHGHLLASLTPQQQQFVQQADPFSSQLYNQNPYLQVPSHAVQDSKKSSRPNVGQQQLLGQQLLGQHQVLYFGAKDGGAEEGSTGSGSGGGYVDSFLGLLGSYWPGQSPDNTIQPQQPSKPPTESAVVPDTEVKPEKLEKEPSAGPAAPVAPSVVDPSRKYYMAPAIKAPQRHYSAALKQPQLSDFHREMFDNSYQQGNTASSFQKMLAAARLKAAQAGAKAALAEQEAQSVSAEDAKEEHNETDKESNEQDQYGPSIAQAKPQAVSVAGMGGVAAAAPVGTAVVGPGGMALSAPHATAVAGAPKRQPQPTDLRTRTSNRHQSQAANYPSNYYYRY